jgi:hypothetical protein
MFDANLRHLPNGHKFFAEIWGCSETCSLYKLGIRKEDVLVLCEMLDNDEENDHENPTIRVFCESDSIVIDLKVEDDNHYSMLLIYAGDYDLKGFLPKDKERLIPLARKLLEEETTNE